MVTHLCNEAALVAAARLGNGDAFGTLIGQYRHHLYRLALRIVGNHEDAEDVTQEASLKAYRNLGRFHGKSRFYTWLVQITVNEALMMLRKRRPQRELPSHEFTAVGDETGRVVRREIEDPGPTPEMQCAELETKRILSEALKTLGPVLYSAFVLQYVEEFSERETAEILGISLTAEKSRVLRARRRLQQSLIGFFDRGPCSTGRLTCHLRTSKRIAKRQ
ncbi:MAG TPA: sigma-70 family RNA polymerase sigma factor [Terriglobia bacterium]|nr:sigma-70 family RNA polymerase sigma factor [Terriglobia bacterium]